MEISVKDYAQRGAFIPAKWYRLNGVMVQTT
jgi:hypothetical protein